MNKKLIVVSAVGLSIAAAGTAMAFENEFHGMFRASGISSNVYTGTSGPFANPYATTPTKLKYNPTTNFFVDQRARLMYSAKASDDLKLVTHFELDSNWGKTAYTQGRTQDGGAIGADTTNIETKSVYLDFNIPGAPVNMKVGIQPIVDSYKGLFFNADAAGAFATAKFGGVTGVLGWSRFDDRGTGGFWNKATRDLLVADAKYSVNKDLKVGGSYYFYNDDKSVASSTGTNLYVNGKDVALHVIGANADANFGPVNVSGFGLYQFGVFGTQHQNAFAANAAAKVNLGMVTPRVSVLYTSGDKNGIGSNSFIPVVNESSAAFGENTFYESNMALLMRSKYELSGSGQALVYESGNFGQGIIAGFVGADVASGKVFGAANAGFMAVAKDNRAARPGTNKSNYQGTEINAEVGYKLYDNMNVTVQGAYLMLGDYYKGTDTATGKDPDNPFLARLMVNYVF